MVQKDYKMKKIMFFVLLLGLASCGRPSEGGLGVISPSLHEETLSNGTRCVVAKYGANISVDCDFK